MVYHLFERIFNPENLVIEGKSHHVKTLISEGFTDLEANQIAWIQSHQTRGKMIGLLVGGFALYTCNGYFTYFQKHIPQLKYIPMFKLLAQATTLYVFYKVGDYYFTSKRYGSNDPRMNGLMYSNRYYSDNKEAFIQNFEPLNRRFTSEEVNQFLLNKNKSESHKRNWIYNPHLHGPNEGEWRKQIHERFDSGKAPWDRSEVRSKILCENKAKVAAGEEITFEPFKTLKHIDSTGIIHRLHPYALSTNFTMIE